MPPQIWRKSSAPSACGATEPATCSRCRYWCSLSRSPVRMKSVVSPMLRIESPMRSRNFATNRLVITNAGSGCGWARRRKVSWRASRYWRSRSSAPRQGGLGLFARPAGNAGMASAWRAGGDRADDVVERGERDRGRPGQVERNRPGREARDVDGLLGDVDGVVAELFEVQGDAEDAAELARAYAVGLLAGDALEALHLDQAEQVVDLVVLLRNLLGEARVALEEGRHAADEL